MPTDAPADLARMLQQQLESLRGAGLTHLPVTEYPIALATQAEPAADVLEAQPAVAADVASPETTPQAATTTSQSSLITENTLASKVGREERGQLLANLAEQVAKCTRCQELAETRTQTVFGVGNPEAQIMFIGEAPGADEDKQGEPFVGRAGQLMNKIIEACELKREDIYICNILRCRPPGNRNPTTDEAANCREYLDGQISTVDPEYIVCWGSVAAQNLLDTNRSIGKMRGDFFRYGRAKVLCTYHPSYLLRNPSAKKQVWEDMKFLMRDLGVEL